MAIQNAKPRRGFLDGLHQSLVSPFYGGFCWTYDIAAWLVSGGMWKRWTFAAEQFLAGEPVLEIGCGRGHLLARLAGRGVMIIGVDLSARMTAASARRLRKANLPGQVICAPTQHIPLPSASVGTVVCTFPTAYVKDEQTWREVARVLRPGGRWVIVETPLLEGFQPRLIGMYLVCLSRFGTLAAARTPPSIGIPAELFPIQRREVVSVGRTRLGIAILEKQ